MAIRLEKGQRINLEKTGGESLKQFCVGCNWGAIVHSTPGLFGLLKKNVVEDVDLDLSCIAVDASGKMIDYIYSPDYKKEFLNSYGFRTGKLTTADGALRHSGDDRKGDQGEDDGLDNEILTINLDAIDPRVNQIFFFLNNVGREDFSMIPYAQIRMYEGTPEKVKEVFAAYDVAAMPEYVGKRALIMGKLYRRDGRWRFAAIGDATDDANLCETMLRIQKDYSA